jgi:hypothetical protein
VCVSCACVCVLCVLCVLCIRAWSIRFSTHRPRNWAGRHTHTHIHTHTLSNPLTVPCAELHCQWPTITRPFTHTRTHTAKHATHRCRKRYAIFKTHYAATLRLKSYFPFTLIDAMGSIEETRQQITSELRCGACVLWGWVVACGALVGWLRV